MDRVSGEWMRARAVAGALAVVAALSEGCPRTVVVPDASLVAEPDAFAIDAAPTLDARLPPPVDARVADDAAVAPDASTSADAGRVVEELRRGVLWPGEVYLAGTLAPGACSRAALAHPLRPDVAAVGFDCEFEPWSAALSPDGTLLYFNTFEALLREFHCDDCPGFVPGDPYPADPLANDTIRPTPPCDPDRMPLGAFRVGLEGEVVHMCGGDWYDELGALVAADVEVLSVGAGSILVRDSSLLTIGTLDRATGVTSPVALPPCEPLAVRARVGGGFVVAVSCETADELWSVAADGTVGRDGTFPAYPPGYQRAWGSELAGDGSLWTIALGPLDFEDAIVRRTVAGASEVVYTEAMDPPPAVEIHISDLVTGP